MALKKSVATKTLIVLLPLFLLAAGMSIYLSYRYQEMHALDLLQNSARAQSTIIKESLVHMMVTAERVDDDYLRRIAQTGDVENISVWFFLDSLHLDPDLVSPRRTKRLRSRQLKPSPDQWVFVEKVFGNGEPQWLVQCEIGKHTEGLVHVLSSGRPLFLNSCERLKVILPFAADRRCLECHRVEEGDVLGAAYMEIPLEDTVEALTTSAGQTVLIFGIFSVAALGMGSLLFRRFVSRPINHLISATHSIGEGMLGRVIQSDFSPDEFGELARSFDVMQERLKESQDQLVHKERLSSVGKMASTIVHDLRSPLSSVMLAVENVRKNGAAANEPILNIVHSSILRINRMAQELLDYSRGELELKREIVSVRDFLNSMNAELGPVLEGKRIRFVISGNFESATYFDRDRLYRALENIINNAADVLPRGGEIRLAVVHDGDSVVFTVSDNGPGIAQEVKDTIFDPFVTFGKAKGTGLGLAITKEIVELHGGSISVESQVGVGTTFTLRLPSRGEKVMENRTGRDITPNKRKV
ncbi:MAG: HAMP domain-containing sensor histidine kinase [Bacteroidota bacterium]